MPHEAKNVTIFGLPRLPILLHLVCPHGQPRYYLLLTGIHRFLAPLFTSIRNLFETSTLPHRHDSTKTRNSARFTYRTASIGHTPKKRNEKKEKHGPALQARVQRRCRCAF